MGLGEIIFLFFCAQRHNLELEGVKTLFISFLFLLSFAGNDWDAFWVLGGKNFAMQKEREKGEEKRAFSIPAPFLPLEGDPPSLRRVKRYEISLYGGGVGGQV